MTEAAIVHATTPTFAKSANVLATPCRSCGGRCGLTLPRDVGLGRILERALAFGATAAIAWELAEFFAFLSRSTEREFAYADTLGDLVLGTAGAVVAAVVLHWSWRRGRLLDPGPLPPRIAV